MNPPTQQHFSYAFPPPPVPQQQQHHHQHHQQQHQQQQQQPVQQQQPSGNAIQDYTGTRNGLTYRLKVEQQPIRARMCGFGDKDRRPITPPPCVRLIVCDAANGTDLDIDKVDSTFCVLQVDLWSEDGTHAVNLVRHSSTSPTVSISSSTITSYPPPPERTMYVPAPPQWHNPQAATQYGQQSPAWPTAFNHPPGTPMYSQFVPPQPVMSIPAPQPNQHYTRNLIGMNAVNACRLNDLEGLAGFWFVLQDLSVRTEGTFRLKFSMCNIGTGQGNNGVISQGKCPVLATAFSDPFTVYSAKKFPGVVESTPLSKCLAQQGIKIPIRKDGPKDRPNQTEYDADE